MAGDMSDVQERLKGTIDGLVNELSGVVDKNMRDFNLVDQNGNIVQIAIGKLQGAVMNYAMGHQAFALSLAGEIGGTLQGLNSQDYKISALIEGLENVEDKRHGKGTGSKWTKPITDCKAWDGFNTLTTNTDSMLDYPEWYSKFKNMCLLVQKSCKRGRFEYMELNKDEDLTKEAAGRDSKDDLWEQVKHQGRYMLTSRTQEKAMGSRQ